MSTEPTVFHVELKGLLEKHHSNLDYSQKERILRFYDLLKAENEIQNLTNLISPIQFEEGHLQDVLELHKTADLSNGAIDLGSGCGVPGLLSACIRPDEWLLVEGEVRKAEFLARAAKDLVEANVRVTHERLESLKEWPSHPVILARAVGSVDKIYEWARKSSTWNTLILFKGPKWNEEWAAARLTRAGKDLIVTKMHEYTVGPELKQRKIVTLYRKPR